MTSAYAELQVTTNFSFLRGGSHAHELAARAKALELSALAVTDRNTLAGAVRAHIAAKQEGLQLVIGARLDLHDAPSLLAFPRDRAAYGRLCRLLTTGQRRAVKGECDLYLADVADHAEGQIFVSLPPENWTWRPADLVNQQFEKTLREINERLDAPVYLAASQLYRGDDRSRIAALSALAARCHTPLIATNDVLYHEPNRRPLQDVLTCIREKCTIYDAGLRLEANAERHLKGPGEMVRLFRGFEEAVSRTQEIVKACTFSLDELAYQYPDEPTPPGKTPQQHLEDLTEAGAHWRYPQGVPDKVADTLKRELALIAELNYAPYFLTVYDIVRSLRVRRIFCVRAVARLPILWCVTASAITSRGPGPRSICCSSAFVSRPSGEEPPDIDVDFEHERREEVIQYLYRPLWPCTVPAWPPP